MMLAHGVNMQRLRLKADGRIVELRDGQEFPLAPTMAETYAFARRVLSEAGLQAWLIADGAPPA